MDVNKNTKLGTPPSQNSLFICYKALKLVISSRPSILILLFTVHNLSTPNRIVDSLQLFRVLMSNVFLVLLKLNVLPPHRFSFFCGSVSTVRNYFILRMLQHSQ